MEVVGQVRDIKRQGVKDLTSLLLDECATIISYGFIYITTSVYLHTSTLDFSSMGILLIDVNGRSNVYSVCTTVDGKGVQ
jgi:hypothetical protein